MDITNTHNFLSAFDVTVSGLSPNLGAQVKASTKLALDDRALTLSDVVAQLGANRVSGRLMTKFSEVLDVSGALNVGTFDLRSPQTVANASGVSNEGSASSATGWSQEPLDIGALKLLNADLNVTGDALITDTL